MNEADQKALDDIHDLGALASDEQMSHIAQRLNYLDELEKAVAWSHLEQVYVSCGIWRHPLVGRLEMFDDWNDPKEVGESLVKSHKKALEIGIKP